MPNGGSTRNELSEDCKNLICRIPVYKVLRDMMVEDEMDYETYKRFKKRFEAELVGGENEETNIY